MSGFPSGALSSAVVGLPPGHAMGAYAGVAPSAAAPVDVRGALRNLGLDVNAFIQIDRLAVARGAPNDGNMGALLTDVAHAWAEFDSMHPERRDLVQGTMVSETNPWRTVSAMSQMGHPGGSVVMDPRLHESAGEMKKQFQELVTQSFGQVTDDGQDFFGTNALADYIQGWIGLIPQNMYAEMDMASGWPVDTADANVESHGFQGTTVPAQLQLAMQSLGDLIYTEWELRDVKYVGMLANIVEGKGCAAADCALMDRLASNLMLKSHGKQEVWAAGGASERGLQVPFGDADYARGQYGVASGRLTGMPKDRAARCAECKRSGLPLQRGEGAFAKKKYCEDCWDEWEADTEMDVAWGGGRRRTRRVQKGGAPPHLAQNMAEGGPDCSAFQKVMAAFGFAGVGFGFWKTLAYFDPQGAESVGTSMSRALRDMSQGLLSTMSAAIRLRNLNIIKAVQDQMTMFFTWAGIDNTLTAIVTSRNRADQRPVRSLTLQAINNMGHWWCQQFPTFEQVRGVAGGGGAGLMKLGTGIKGVASAMMGGTVNWVRGWGKDRGNAPYAASERVAGTAPSRRVSKSIQDTVDNVVESNAEQNPDMMGEDVDGDETHGAVAAGAVTGALLTHPEHSDAIVTAGAELANSKAESVGDRSAWVSQQSAAAGAGELGTSIAGPLMDHGSGVAGPAGRRRGRRGGSKGGRRTRRKPSMARHRKPAVKKTRARRNVNKGRKTRGRK